VGFSLEARSLPSDVFLDDTTSPAGLSLFLGDSTNGVSNFLFHRKARSNNVLSASITNVGVDSARGKVFLQVRSNAGLLSRATGSNLLVSESLDRESDLLTLVAPTPRNCCLQTWSCRRNVPLLCSLLKVANLLLDARNLNAIPVASSGRREPVFGAIGSIFDRSTRN